MIRKFAAASRVRVVSLAMVMVTILAGAVGVVAQQAPAQPSSAQPAPAQQSPSAAPSATPSAQQPDNQQSSSQEASAEEATPARKIKPRDYKNWTFNAGGGADLFSGTTQKFVRGGGGVVAAGVARNYSKYFGFRADFQWDNLPLRNSALGLAQAPSGSAHVYAVMLDPVITIPATKVWSGYFMIGPGYYHRAGKLDSSTIIPGAGCNSFYAWWGTCSAGSLPLSGKFLSSSQNSFGFNFGVGIARKINSKVDFFAEFHDMHGSRSGTTTDVRPITVGLRW